MIEFLIKYPILYLPILAVLIMVLGFNNLKKTLSLKNYIVFLLLTLSVENMLDYFFTMKEISSGFVIEANPIAFELIQNGSLGFFKGIISIYFLLIIVVVVRKPKKFTNLCEKITLLMASIYTALMIYHLFILYYLEIRFL